MYSEHEIQFQVQHFLQANNYYVFRLNSGSYSVGEGKYKRFIMGQVAGTPDLLAIKNRRHPLFVEIKKPGNKPTRLQKEKMEELEEYGAECIVVTSLEEIEAYVQANK